MHDKININRFYTQCKGKYFVYLPKEWYKLKCQWLKYKKFEICFQQNIGGMSYWTNIRFWEMYYFFYKYPRLFDSQLRFFVCESCFRLGDYIKSHNMHCFDKKFQMLLNRSHCIFINLASLYRESYKAIFRLFKTRRFQLLCGFGSFEVQSSFK